MHRYKDPARSFAAILAEETEHEDRGGGTGKGIFFKALGYLRSIITIDGKGDKAEKSFRFQRVGPDTDLILLEDVKKNMDFGGFYPMITEGVTVEKKNQAEVFYPYEVSPKLAFTTNYTISNIGNHAKRRQRVLEFSNFFSPARTPEMYFKQLLFVDWDTDEWNRFYNYMFLCCGLYLDKGIKEIDNSVSIRRKQVKQHFTEEFLNYWDAYAANGRTNWTLFSEMYSEFLSSAELEKRDFSAKRFKKGIEDTAQLFGYKLEKQINRQHNNRPEYRCLDVVDSRTCSRSVVDFSADRLQS